MAKPKHNPDLWAHRSAGMTCATCMWAAEKVSEDGNVYVGRCRKRAPTATGYPVIFMSDWCGDHKLDENKL